MAVETTPDQPAPTGEAHVSARGVRKYFFENASFLSRLIPQLELKVIHAVDGVDLDIERGKVMGLVGESGCGKSTLARLLLRLIEPTEGSIHIDGRDVTELSRSELVEFHRNAQMIFQNPIASLNPRHSILRIIREPMRVHGMYDSEEERNAKVIELLEQVGLDEDFLPRYPGQVSGGQCQRVAIARALALEPDILIADEPTSSLDVSVQSQILNLIRRIQAERDLTMLFISHDLSVIQYISDTVGVMYLGEIVESGPTEAVFEDPKHPYTQALFSSIPSPDPKERMERIELEGDVPSPINPPSGCRFHTRCPQVIPPEGWDASQDAWRLMMNLKQSLNQRTQDLDERESELHDPQTLIETEFTDEVRATLSTRATDLVEEVESHVSEEDFVAAHEVLESAYTTPCESVDPELLELGSDREVACLLYD